MTCEKVVQNTNLQQNKITTWNNNLKKKKDCIKGNNLQFQNHYPKQQQHGRSFSDKEWWPLSKCKSGLIELHQSIYVVKTRFHNLTIYYTASNIQSTRFQVVSHWLKITLVRAQVWRAVPQSAHVEQIKWPKNMFLSGCLTICSWPQQWTVADWCRHAFFAVNILCCDHMQSSPFAIFIHC